MCFDAITLQETLLHHLGISSNPTSTEPWPLQVRPRTLAILAEVLLLNQQNERDSLTTLSSASLSTAKRGSETVVMHIWTRLMSALADSAVAVNTSTCAADMEDMNVEHIQLIMFLFQNGLTLMQKKSLWLELCQVIVRVTGTLTGRQGDAATSSGTSRLNSISPLPLSRLLLIADYLLHYFYDMPPSLLEQVLYVILSKFC